MQIAMHALRCIPLVFLGLLVGCAGTPSMVAAPATTEWVSPGYLIGPDDVVTVSVWQHPELGTTGPVRSDGKITVPLIGDVQAGGRTPMAVAGEIETSLAAIVRDARVSVLLTELHSHAYLTRVRVTGAVRQPVSLPYRQGMTVLDALLEAGGPTDFAAAGGAALHRREGTASRSYPIALGAMLEGGDLSSNYDVRPGDVITVRQRSF